LFIEDIEYIILNLTFADVIYQSTPLKSKFTYAIV